MTRWSSKTPDDPVAHFWARVDVRGEGECWPWRASINDSGYGRFKLRGRPLKAHRYAYQATFGDIPQGLLVCHHCDNPPCCNPAHLFLGTNADNSMDKVRKGRARTTYGERCHFAKLRWSDVVEIRRRLAAGEPLAAIARAYSVSWAAIYDIKLGRTWQERAQQAARVAA